MDRLSAFNASFVFFAPFFLFFPSICTNLTAASAGNTFQPMTPARPGEAEKGLQEREEASSSFRVKCNCSCLHTRNEQSMSLGFHHRVTSRETRS